MITKITDDAPKDGYSFSGDHSLPDRIAELRIHEGVAVRIAENAVNKKANRALRNAKQRDTYR